MWPFRKREQHDCPDCEHYHTRIPEPCKWWDLAGCWRMGRHDFETGKFNPHECSTDPNWNGYCRAFRPRQKGKNES